MDVEMVEFEWQGRSVVSSALTPGFFVQGATSLDATRAYVQVLRAHGPMPMLDTRLPAEPAPPVAGAVRTQYLGFPSDLNFGDRWMYRALAQRLPSLAFWHPASALERWRCALPASEFELTMLGGGTLINQKPQFYQDVLCSLAAKVPCVCFGTGVGEVQRWGDHLDAWVGALRQFTYVGVRGPESHAALAARGLEGHVTSGDPCLLDTLLFASPSTRERAELWVDLSFGVRESKESLEFRVRLLEALGRLEREGAASLQFYSSWDVYLPWLTQLLAAQLPGKREILSLKDDNRQLLQRADVAVAYRLHAGAAALMAGVPTYFIEYESKCRDFASFLGLDDWVLPPNRDGAEQLDRALSREGLSSARKKTHAVREAVKAGKATTEGHFARFVEHLASP